MKLGLKSLFSFSLLFLSGAVAMSAGLGPNTAKKFEGVWKAPDGSRIYMGPVNGWDHQGRYVVTTARGQKYEHIYEIVSSDEVKNTILIEIILADKRMPSVKHELTLQKDPTRCSRSIHTTNKSVLGFLTLKKQPSDMLIYQGKRE